MLVLSRKRNEVVVIRHPGLPAPIRIIVSETRSKLARLSFDADPSINIVREEILTSDS